jgi:hypothetical protein
MTREKCDAMIKATREGKLFDWLYDHGSEIDKDEMATIARELAYAIETTGVYPEIKDVFVNQMADHYSTWGFDDDDEE